MYKEDQLMHYGVKGMKWGVRRAAKLQSKADLYRRYAEDYDVKGYTVPLREKEKVKLKRKYDEHMAIADKYQRKANDIQAKENAKANAKAKTQASTKAAVKDYKKTFDSAEKLQDTADAKYAAAREQYKSLGKNKISRMLNAAKGTSDAAKQYSKLYDDAERAQNVADKKWNEVSDKYKNTGRNRVERIMNNIKHG